MSDPRELVKKLAEFYRRRKSMSAEQIKQFLFDRQDDVEECWETGRSRKCCRLSKLPAGIALDPCVTTAATQLRMRTSAYFTAGAR